MHVNQLEQSILIFKFSGVVIGCLNIDGSIDKEKTRKLIELARPMSITFHRGIDMSKDIFEAVKVLFN